MKSPKPWMYDGILTASSSGLLARVDEPRWWQVFRLFKRAMRPSCEVTFTQCGHTTVCKAQLVNR